MQLARFPRVKLAHAPTPLEPMANLTRHLGGPRLWVKRDDCTGLALGGNKVRKLEFLLGEAIEQGADTVIATGAVQSNHVRQTAAAAKLGLKCRLLVDERVSHPTPEYRSSGNLFLDHLLGTTLECFPAGTDMQAAMDAEAARLTGEGARAFVVAGGGSDCAGALGYVWCAQELLAQADDCGLVIDWVVHATGSGGTQAGLVAAFEAMRAGVPVLGIAVSRAKSVQEALVFDLARQTAEHLGAGDAVARDAVRVDDRFYGPGYGVPTAQMVEAVTLAARLEGLLLDPVYSGKAMAGLIGLVREGYFGNDDNVVFIHTGGTPGLFAYTAAFAPAIGLDVPPA